MSKVLRGTEQQYPIIEKITYVVVISVARLRTCFQIYTMVVKTDLPLRKVLQKVKTFGRLVKWAIRLGEFDMSQGKH